MGSVIKRSQYMGVCGVVSTARSGGGACDTDANSGGLWWCIIYTIINNNTI